METKNGNRAAVIAEGYLSPMGIDNLPHQMQSQNVGRVGIHAGIGEILQNRFRVACAVVPDFQHELSIHNFCRYLNLTSRGIMSDTVVQEIIHGSCQQFFVRFQRCLPRRFPDQEVNAVGAVKF